jgi:hypothetical protein
MPIPRKLETYGPKTLEPNLITKHEPFKIQELANIGNNPFFTNGSTYFNKRSLVLN